MDYSTTLFIIHHASLYPSVVNQQIPTQAAIMSRRQTSNPKQESHRVYLQQFSKDPGSKEASLKTKSTAIRLTSITTSNEVCSLLRQKFGLPTRPQSSSIQSSGNDGRVIQNKKKAMPLSSPTPLVHRIHAHLNQVRQGSASASSGAGNNQSFSNGASPGVKSRAPNLLDIKRKQKRKQRRKRLLEIQSSEDAIVMVAACSLPKNYVHFEHENEDYFGMGGGSTAQRLSLETVNSASNPSVENPASSRMTALSNERSTQGNYLYSREPFNVFETLLPSEIPLQKKEELISKVDQIQDRAEIEVFGKKIGSKKNRKAPLIHLFFIPCHNDQTQRATIDVDGYCTEADTDSDDDGSLNELQMDVHRNKDDDKKQLKCLDTTPAWQQEVEEYNTTKIYMNDASWQDTSRLRKERHCFTVLSTFEAVNGNENSSGYLLKQSKKDKNVWKRVHCVLTENQFWYVSRVKRIGKQHGTRIGCHGIIDLNGTLLFEPMFDSPLSDLPNTFQLTTKEGKVHIFQAGNKNAYLRWSQCLSERIVLCQENSSLGVTDIIISKEASSRQKRCEDFLNSTLNSTCTNQKQTSLLINLGIRIAEYKEKCKQLQHTFSLHAKQIQEVALKPSLNDLNKQFIHRREWLRQSLATWHFAEILRKDCENLSILLLNSNVDKITENLPIERILEMQNEMKQCLNQFSQFHYEHFHKRGNVKSQNNNIITNRDNDNQDILLPEALFDQIFVQFVNLVNA